MFIWQKVPAPVPWGQCWELQPKVWKSQTCLFHSDRETTKQLIGDQMSSLQKWLWQKKRLSYLWYLFDNEGRLFEMWLQPHSNSSPTTQNVTKCLKQQAADYRCSNETQLNSSTVGGKQNYNKVLQLCRLILPFETQNSLKLLVNMWFHLIFHQQTQIDHT